MAKYAVRDESGKIKAKIGRKPDPNAIPMPDPEWEEQKAQEEEAKQNGTTDQT